MDNVLLTTGLSQEVATHNVRKYGTAFVRGFSGGWYAVMDEYDKVHPVVKPCTGDIRCERTGRRHKAGCLGKDVPFDEYARALA